MYLKTLYLQKFRCFTEITLPLAPGINLIEGTNGSGKTSILEALHYLCYLRSFRTFFPRELVQLQESGFFIRASFGQTLALPDTILQIGFSLQKRVIKIDQSEVKAYSELLSLYTAISFVEDDLDLIKGQPLMRRSCLDQFIALYTPNYLLLLLEYKRILANRNALIQRLAYRFEAQSQEYTIWTEQLQAKACAIQDLRSQALINLQLQVNLLLARYFPDTQLSIELIYQPKVLQLALPELLNSELRLRRSLFGAHLDDFTINFCQLKSRIFASRGQQKLILTLLKLAQKICVEHSHNVHATKALPATLLLLDDFMTDLDEHWLQILVQALQELGCQLIFTCPTQQQSAIRTILQRYPINQITL